MKILMSAYACEPGKGSEPGVGWNFAVAAAGYHQVWVLTRMNNRNAIEAELANNPIPNLHFVYHDLPTWAMWWKQGGRGVQLYYYLWQLSAYFSVKALHEEIGFDVGHHVTFGKYWSPSFFSFISMPYILGPLGGGESVPAAFFTELGLKGFFYETARILARHMGESDMFVQRTLKRACFLWAKSTETQKRLLELGMKGADVLSEVGFSDLEISKLKELSTLHKTDTFRIIFVSVGNLLALKGFHLGLKAFAAANIADAEYWIVGTGPERKRLEKIAETLGIKSQVRFLGYLPRNITLTTLAKCHVLVHPSLHDSGGWVCIEAMALGKPVICLDLGGPATQVTAETGFKVQAITPTQAVADIAQAMKDIAKNNDLRTSMGKNGQERVNNIFAWDKKISILNSHYLYVSQMKFDAKNKSY